MKRLLFFMLLPMVACSPSKGDYIEDYTDFVRHVERDYSRFSSEDWTEADEEFRRFSEEDYLGIAPQLTDSERHEVEKLDAIYLGIKMKVEARNALDSLMRLEH